MPGSPPIPAIREVILTGGDPLMLSPRRLGAIVAALSAIPHIETLRIHSRVPVADPDRLTDALAAAMETDRSLWLVVHANHAREFTPAAGAGAAPRAGRAASRCSASRCCCVASTTAPPRWRRCSAPCSPHRVKPYYLHQLDPAPGTARFHVPIEEGRALLASLRGRVTGLAWPTYVLDIPGGHGKVPIGPDYRLDEGAVRDIQGSVHRIEVAQQD